MFVLESLEDGKEQENMETYCDSAYMTQLKRLNYEVCEWVKKHINENPYVDLSPVFKDYDKHLLNLEKKFPAITRPTPLSDNVSTKSTTVSTASVDVGGGSLTSSPAVVTLNGGELCRCYRTGNRFPRIKGIHHGGEGHTPAFVNLVSTACNVGKTILVAELIGNRW